MGVGSADANSATPRTPETRAAKGQRVDPVELHAAKIRNLVLRGDAVAVDYVVKAARRGLPPRALEAFLDAAREKPNEAYLPLLRKMARYRKDTIRARALVALASLGDDHGPEAALRALDDPTLDIRLLGLDLARQHTAPDVEEAVIRLLDRDRELAALVKEVQAREAAKKKQAQ